MMPTKTLAIELLAPYTAVALKAEVFNLAGVSQSTYTNSAFSAVDSNGVRVLTYSVPSISFQGTVVIKTADDVTVIGTHEIEGASSNDVYDVVINASYGNAALLTAINGVGSVNITDIVNAVNGCANLTAAATNSLAAATILASSSFGNAAIFTAIGTLATANQANQITAVVEALPTSLTINIMPLTSALVSDAYFTNGVEDLPLSCSQGEDRTFSIAITSGGDDVDLTGKSLRFVVCDSNYDGLFQITTPTNITINGNVVSINLTSTQTNHRDFKGSWELWDTTANQVIGKGSFRIDGRIKSL